MTSKITKQDKQEPVEAADTDNEDLQSFYFPELSLSIKAATLKEATQIAEDQKGGKK